MKHLYILLTVLICITSCSKEEKKPHNLTSYIPNNSTVIISAPSIKKLHDEISENSFLNRFKNTNTYKKLEKDFSFFKNINSENPIIISYATVGKTSEFLFATKTNNTVHNLTVNKTVNNYNDVAYNSLKNQKAFTLEMDSTLFVSSSEILIENLIRNNTDNIEFKDESFFRLYNTKNNNKTTTYLNNKRKQAAFNKVFPTNLLGELEWTAIDFDNVEGILINGITSNTNIKSEFITNLQKAKTEKRQSSSVIPLNFSNAITYSYDELNNYESSSESFNELIENSTEILKLEKEKTSLLAIRLNDDFIANKFTEETNYRNTIIYKNNYYQIPNVIFKTKPNYACYIDNFLVFSDNIKSLKNCISHFENKTTLESQHFFNENNNALLEEAHVTDIRKINIIKNNLSQLLNDNSINKVTLKEFPVLMNQITFEDNYIQFNSVIKKINSQKVKPSISQIYNINIPEKIRNNAQWVVNHRTNEKELIVQDFKNVLYLISNKGKILWTKQLNEAIQGKITQVDLFKNKKLQLAFTTKNEFLVLDRNGKVVEQYHKKYANKNLLPLSVFDYDKNRNYRFIVTYDNTIEVFDNNFKPVNGFKFNKTESSILKSPKHILIGTKDYIIIPEKNGTLHIVNRQGQLRTTVKNKFDFDDNAFYKYKNSIVFKDRKNIVNSVNISTGKNSKLDILQGSSFNKINYVNNLNVKLEDNILSINDKSIELDYGNYTVPKIISYNNKNYINITDLENEKVYLYNSKGELLDQFPVYGKSEIALTNINKDSNLEFAVKSEENALLIYKMY